MAGESGPLKQFHNRARAEVKALEWPEYLGNREGELLREIDSLRRSRNFWMTLALFLFACAYAFVAVMLLFK